MKYFDVEYTITVEAETHTDAANLALKRIRETKSDERMYLYVKPEGQDSDEELSIAIQPPADDAAELRRTLRDVMEFWSLSSDELMPAELFDRANKLIGAKL